MDEVYEKDDQVIEATQVDILQLKDNNIPKCLIPLEDLFDRDDVERKPTLVATEKGVKDVNIGTTEKPKNDQAVQIIISRGKREIYSFIV